MFVIFTLLGFLLFGGVFFRILLLPLCLFKDDLLGVIVWDFSVCSAGFDLAAAVVFGVVFGVVFDTGSTCFGCELIS